MTFLISEDEALRNLLLGMTVTDQKAASEGSTTRSVKVYFGQPDQEIRSQSYPYIVIDMIDISEDNTRAMRGMVKPIYMDDPETMPAVQGLNPELPYNSTTNDWMIRWPIPVNIDYQVL